MLRREGEPEDIANAVFFCHLTRQTSSQVRSWLLTVDGRIS
jgi:hypothetical protein